MKHYVLVFAHPIPFANTEDVLMILRKKDDWQTGKLNLLGGSIEDGETPEQAAVRELREEAGITGVLADTKVLGTLHSGRATVEVCFVPYRNWHDGAAQVPRTCCDEGEVIGIRWREAMNDPRLIPNLKFIIPLCQSRLSGWVMREAEGGQIFNLQLV